MKKIVILFVLMMFSLAAFAQENTAPQATSPETAQVSNSAAVPQSQDKVVIIKSVGKDLSFNKLVVYYNRDRKVQVSIAKGAQAQVEQNEYKIELSDGKGLRVNFYLKANSNVKIDFQKTEITLSGDNFSYYLTDDIR